jgi:hypothetical protein
VEINSFNLKEDLNEIIIKKWVKKERLYYRYRFINNVPLKDDKKTINVNWIELAIIDKDRNVRKHFAFATNHTITKDNVVYIVEAGHHFSLLQLELNSC